MKCVFNHEQDIEVVAEATTGAEAVELAMEHHPDVVVMDIRMPKMDGLTALGRIKIEHPDMPVLIFSGFENPTYVARAAALDACEYLLKSAPSRELVEAVRRALNQQTPPEDVNIVPITNHTIDSEYEPEIDVVVQGVPVHTFKFKVSATLDVQGGDLVVQRGAIQEIRLASLKLGGAIKLGDRTLLKKNVADVTVPGVMRLTKPIPILSDTAEQRLSA